MFDAFQKKSPLYCFGFQSKAFSTRQLSSLFNIFITFPMAFNSLLSARPSKI